MYNDVWGCAEILPRISTKIANWQPTHEKIKRREKREKFIDSWMNYQLIIF